MSILGYNFNPIGHWLSKILYLLHASCSIVYSLIQLVVPMTLAEANKKSLESLDEKALLVRLIDEVRQINQKLGKVLNTQEDFLQKVTKTEWSKPTKLDPDMLSLISLPKSLRKTVLALYKLGKATADDLSKETERLRAVESASANQLVRIGFIAKTREGRKVYFYIK